MQSFFIGNPRAELQLMPYLVLDLFEEYPGVAGLFVAAVYAGSLRYYKRNEFLSMFRGKVLAIITFGEYIHVHFLSMDQYIF